MSNFRFVKPRNIHIATLVTVDDVLGGQEIPVLAFTNKRKALRYIKAANIKEQIESAKIQGRSRYFTLDTIRVL